MFGRCTLFCVWLLLFACWWLVCLCCLWRCFWLCLIRCFDLSMVWFCCAFGFVDYDFGCLLGLVFGLWVAVCWYWLNGCFAVWLVVIMIFDSGVSCSVCLVCVYCCVLLKLFGWFVYWFCLGWMLLLVCFVDFVFFVFVLCLTFMLWFWVGSSVAVVMYFGVWAVGLIAYYLLHLIVLLHFTFAWFAVYVICAGCFWVFLFVWLLVCWWLVCVGCG